MSIDVKWLGPFPLFSQRPQRGSQIENKPGVYRVRAFDRNGQALQISRLADVDPQGILHIGKSVTLKSRIQAFRRSAEDGRNGHKAGIEFDEYQFDKLIPRTSLRCDYVYTQNETEALELERALHEEYRKQYLDRPPLDGTSGQFSS